MENDKIANDALAAIKYALSFTISNWQDEDAEYVDEQTLDYLRQAEERLAKATQITVSATN